MNQGIIGTQTRQLFIDLEPVGEFATAGVGVAQNLQGFDIIRIAADNSFEKTDFHIQVAQFLTSEFFSELNVFFGIGLVLINGSVIP